MDAKKDFSTITIGTVGTPEYRVYFKKNGEVCSPFHDIPLWADQTQALINMVVEIPRATNPKLEISKGDYLNPIRQDVKNGKLRYVHDKYPFNYGAISQTWENPAIVHEDTKAKGDNDPLDVVEIGDAFHKTGDLIVCKVLGTYAMIDEGETDWKILVIDINDRQASKCNDLDDIEKVFPGKLKEVHQFLRDYKIPDGKPPNTFAFNSEPKDKKFAVTVIEETHAEWKKLITKEIPNKTEKYSISCACTQLESKLSPHVVDKEEAEKHVINEFASLLRSKH